MVTVTDFMASDMFLYFTLFFQESTWNHFLPLYHWRRAPLSEDVLHTTSHSTMCFEPLFLIGVAAWPSDLTEGPVSYCWKCSPCSTALRGKCWTYSPVRRPVMWNECVRQSASCCLLSFKHKCSSCTWVVISSTNNFIDNKPQWK